MTENNEIRQRFKWKWAEQRMNIGRRSDGQWPLSILDWVPEDGYYTPKGSAVDNQWLHKCT